MKAVIPAYRWERQLNGDYVARLPTVVGRIEHEPGRSRVPHVHASLRTSPGRELIIAERFASLTTARAWSQQQIEAWLAGRIGLARHRAQGAPRSFEVAVHVDGRNTAECTAALAARMHTEARRLGLVEPRHVSSSIDRHSDHGREIRVWHCVGTRR